MNNLHPVAILDAVCDAKSSVRGPAASDGPSQQRTSALSRFSVCSSSSFFLLRLKNRFAGSLTADVPYRKLPERLEVDPSKHSAVDLANIVQRPGVKVGPLEALAPPTYSTTVPRHDRLSEDFVDDPDVPPLI